MFTGIIEETGRILRVQRGAKSAALTIQGEKILTDLHLGDSIAVNGVCLTATSRTAAEFTADVMHETLNRSSLGALRSGSRVNLERAMPADGRFGGHIVTGHIDGTGIIRSIENDGVAVWYTISAPDGIMRYIVEKGSVAIDGISLTVARVSGGCFSVSVIPHTISNTVLPEKKAGGIVNLENDIIGKYIEKLMSHEGQSPRESPGQSHGQSPRQDGITRDYLIKYGF